MRIMSKIKVAAIIILVAVAFILCINIWFEDMSMFGLFRGNESGYAEILSGDEAVISPDLLILFSSEKDCFYEVRRTRAEFDEWYFITRRLMQQQFLYGSIEKKEGVPEITGEKDYVYMEYGYCYDSFSMTEDLKLNIKKKAKLDFYFDEIFFIISDTEVTTIYVNTKDSSYTVMSIDRDRVELLSRQAYQRLGELMTGEIFERILSTSREGSDSVKDNTYLPYKKEQAIYNAHIELTPPFLTAEGTTNLEELDSFISAFFANPLTKYMVEGDASKMIVYRNQSVIMRYNVSNRVLEYTDTIIEADKKKKENIFLAYSYAKTFLKNDKYFNEQEINLAKFERIDGSIHFYFNYAINDYTIKLSQKQKSEMSMEYPLEIVITAGKVSYCRRYILIQNPDMQSVVASFDYQKAVAKARELGYITNKVDTIHVAYRMSEEKNSLELCWVLEADGKEYFIQLD